MERAEPVLSSKRVGMLRVGVALAMHPRLWGTCVVQVRRLARRGWWRQWPPLPLPDDAYMRFRLQTQYGDPEHPPEADDLVDYLKWCRAERRHLG